MGDGDLLSTDTFTDTAWLLNSFRFWFILTSGIKSASAAV